jgi:hypothetical protein
MTKTTTTKNKEGDGVFWSIILLATIIAIASSSLGFGIFSFLMLLQLDQISTYLKEILKELQRVNGTTNLNLGEDDGKS